jgi:hypothetical protein
VRLSPGQWAWAGAILAGVFFSVPRLWETFEPLPECANSRVPYRLSDDYWTFARYCRRAAARRQLAVIGDSVVWGHYASKDGTLPAHLNRLCGDDRFANLGVDGVHPGALVGLIDCYAGPLRGGKVLVHCNLLWTSSPERDLSTAKEAVFNHPGLVPQFWPERPPAFHEPLSGRLGNVVVRNCGFLGWSKHLQLAYFSEPAEEDGPHGLPAQGDPGEPPVAPPASDWATWTLRHPYESPGTAFGGVPASPSDPPSPPPVARPWTEQAGVSRQNFRWVDLARSFQWRSFRRVVDILRRRGNEVFVLVGPFNEHMLTPRSLAAYQSRRSEVEHWLAEQLLAHHVAAVLPSELYADASHPLEAGYALLAQRLASDPEFRRFAGLGPIVGDNLGRSKGLAEAIPPRRDAAPPFRAGDSPSAHLR